MDSNNKLHHEQETEHMYGGKEWEKELEEAEQRGYKNGVRAEKKRVTEEKIKHNNQKKEVVLLFLLVIVIAVFAGGAYTFISGRIKLAGDGWFWGFLLALGLCIFNACAGEKGLSEDTRGSMGVFQSFLSGIKEFWKDIRRNNKLFALFIICLGCLIGGVVGKFKVVQRTLSATEKFGKEWISYESKDLKDKDGNEAVEQYPQMNESAKEKPTEESNDSGELNGKGDSVAFIEKSD